MYFSYSAYEIYSLCIVYINPTKYGKIYDKIQKIACQTQ